MQQLITVIHILACAGVIGLVLLQHGKGADMGAAFGSGTSGSLFGVTGSSNLLSKLTAVCVTIFFITSITLAYLASHNSASGSVIKVPAATELKTDSAKPVDAAPAVNAEKDSATKDIPN
jgi:preprotein translocase subunit SecG